MAREETFAMSNSRIDVSYVVVEIIFCLAGVALYNAIELLFLVFISFKRWDTLYFWSILITSFSIIPYTLFLLFKFFGVVHVNVLSACIIALSWQVMVTGQSVVMYSRLHLVSSSRKLTRNVLVFIVVTWVIAALPTTVFVIAVQTKHARHFNMIYGVWERLQICLYFVQETVIALLYVWGIVKKLKQDSMLNNRSVRSGWWSRSARNVLKHLGYVNIVVILLDITLLVVEFAGLYEIQVLYKGALYSVKLKLEFWILNQLTLISSHRLRQSQKAISGDDDTHELACFSPALYGFHNTNESSSSGKDPNSSPGTTSPRYNSIIPDKYQPTSVRQRHSSQEIDQEPLSPKSLQPKVRVSIVPPG